MFFLEKHSKIPIWGKNLVKNNCLLCSRNLLSIFLHSCLMTGQNHFANFHKKPKFDTKPSMLFSWNPL